MLTQYFQENTLEIQAIEKSDETIKGNALII